MKLEKFKNIEIIESLDNLTPIEGRRQIINTKNKGTFIIDYAHTSEAFKNIFGDFPTKKKVYTLFGCGGERDKSKRSEIGNIVDSYSTGIVITEDNSRMENFKVITRDIIKGIKNTNKLIIIESRKAAIKYLFKNSYPNHLNFILGKGNEDYIMKKNMKKKHNDITFLRNIIKNYET